MSDNAKISIIFLCNLLLFFVVGEVNFLLGSLSLHFHADALLLMFFGLYLVRLSGLVYAILLGFIADATAPVPHGTYVLGYLLLWWLLIWGQRRIRRQNKLHVRSLVTATQLVWMLVLTLVMGFESADSGVYLNRVIMEILFSCALTYAIAWPWCAFQKNMLRSFGWNIEAEMSKI